MSRAQNPSKSSVLEERVYRLRLLGTGAADPTVEVGVGMTVTQTGVGVIKVAFNEAPGHFVNFHYGLGAATPSDVKGHTVTRDTYTAPTSSADGFIEFSVWNASEAADELQATEYLDLTIAFAECPAAELA
jgi:hypothetical protein